MQVGILHKKGELEPVAEEAQEAVISELGILGHSIVFITDVKDIKDKLHEKKLDLLFNLLDEHTSRNHAAQAVIICEALDIPFTGSDGIALALACDKHLAKVVAAAGGVSVAEGEVIRELGDLEEVLLPLPLFCKPLYGSNGLAISIDSLIKEESELYSKVGKILGEVEQPVLLEEYIAGREFAVGLWGSAEPEVIGIVEIAWAKVGKQPFIFNFGEYARNPEQVKMSCPAEIDSDLATDIANIARIAWQALGCRGYATVDIRLNNEGMPHFLELDAVPCLHPGLGNLPYIAAKMGIKYTELIEGIIKLAL